MSRHETRTGARAAVRRQGVRAGAAVAGFALALMAPSAALYAQRGAPQPTATAQAAAPVDLTGQWVSMVTQDWRWRMITPPKGDYRGIPMTAEAWKVAEAWDPARDEKAGEQCKSYGAPALMSVPGRVRISWQDAETLKVETDAGTQTRLLRFKSQPGARRAPRSWQGDSAAEWQVARGNAPLNLRPAERTPGVPPPAIGRGGTLKVVTTNLRAGYLRKNGVPYSEDTVLTEYWEVLKRDNGEQWLTITTLVEDPKYLRQTRMVAIPFKKEAGGAAWDPTPCSARW
jgi:hypothetical protein